MSESSFNNFKVDDYVRCIDSKGWSAQLYNLKLGAVYRVNGIRIVNDDVTLTGMSPYDHICHRRFEKWEPRAGDWVTSSDFLGSIQVGCLVRKDPAGSDMWLCHGESGNLYQHAHLKNIVPVLDRAPLENPISEKRLAPDVVADAATQVNGALVARTAKVGELFLIGKNDVPEVVLYLPSHGDLPASELHLDVTEEEVCRMRIGQIVEIRIARVQQTKKAE